MKQSTFNFNEMSKLAKENPAEFDRIAKEMVQDTIDSASPQNRKRLEGIVFELDMMRKKHKGNNYIMCIEVSKMMFNSLHKLQGALNGQHETAQVQQSEVNEETNKILEFPMHRKVEDS